MVVSRLCSILLAAALAAGSFAVPAVAAAQPAEEAVSGTETENTGEPVFSAESEVFGTGPAVETGGAAGESAFSAETEVFNAEPAVETGEAAGESAFSAGAEAAGENAFGEAAQVPGQEVFPDGSADAPENPAGCAITLDAGTDGYFIDENGGRIQSVRVEGTKGESFQNIKGNLPVPATDTELVFLGWSLQKDPFAEGPAVDSAAGANPFAEGTAVDSTAGSDPFAEGPAVDSVAANDLFAEGSAVDSAAVVDPFAEGPAVDGTAVLDAAGETSAAAGMAAGNPFAEEGAAAGLVPDDFVLEGDISLTAVWGAEEKPQEQATDAAPAGENSGGDNDSAQTPFFTEEGSGGESPAESAPAETDGTGTGPEETAPAENGGDGTGIDESAPAENDGGGTGTEETAPADIDETGTGLEDPAQAGSLIIGEETGDPALPAAGESAGEEKAEEKTEKEVFFSEGGGTDTANERASNSRGEETTRYTVTFQANGGYFEDGQTSVTRRIREGRSIEADRDRYEEPEREGFAFKGWSLTKDGKAFEEYEVTKDLTVYAVWAELKTIVFDANGHYLKGWPFGRIRTTRWEETFEKGEKIDLEEYDSFYYDDIWEKFGGWSLTRTGPALTSNTYTVTKDVTLYAVWIGDLEDAEIQLAKSSVVYTGKAQTPAVTVEYNDRTLVKGTDYTVAYSNNTKAGRATVTVTGMGRFTGKVSTTFTITKRPQSLTLTTGASRLSVGTSTTVKGSGAKETTRYTYKSSNTSVATVTSAGKVTAKKVGTVKITVSTAATTNYKAGSRTVTIKVVPGVTSKLTAANQKKGVKLTWARVAGANGYYLYRDGKKIATISKGTTLTYLDTKANKNGRKYVYKLISKASTGTSTLYRSVSLYRTASSSSGSTSSGSSQTGASGTSTSSGSSGSSSQSGSSGSSSQTSGSGPLMTTRFCFEQDSVAATLDKCAQNDLAVIDLDGVSQSVITAARNRGVQIYGYLNAGALESERSYYEKFKSIRLAAYDGWPGEYWVDVTNTAWKTHLIEEARKMKAMGATGLYLDNTDILYMVEAGFQEEKTSLIRIAPTAGNVYKALSDVVKQLENTVGIVVMPNGGDIFVRRFVKDNPGLLKTVVQESVLYDGNKRQPSSETKYYTEYLDWCISQGIYVRGIEYTTSSTNAQTCQNYYKDHGWQELYISKHTYLMGD